MTSIGKNINKNAMVRDKRILAQQALANTMARLVDQADHGQKSAMIKIHAIWETAKAVPKEYSMNPQLGKLRSKYGKEVSRKLHGALLRAYFANDNVRLHGQPHVEPAGGRLAWFLRSDYDRRNTNNSCGLPQETLDDSQAWDDTLGDFTEEGFEGEFPEDFSPREALITASLAAGSHGWQVLEAKDLPKIRDSVERCRMATGSDLESDGCEIRKDRKSYRHSGMTFSDSVRHAIGPWSYEFIDQDGNAITLGYEGMASTMQCVKCGALLAGDTCLNPDCGYNPRWDLEQDSHERVEYFAQANAKKWLGDTRLERSDAFEDEWLLANAKVPKGALTRSYQDLWAHYRGAQLRIAKAIRRAPKDHSLWSLMYLTKDQFLVLEQVYAARLGLLGVEQTQYGERARIGQRRLTDKEVMRKQGLV